MLLYRWIDLVTMEFLKVKLKSDSYCANQNFISTTHIDNKYYKNYKIFITLILSKAVNYFSVNILHTMYGSILVIQHRPPENSRGYRILLDKEFNIVGKMQYEFHFNLGL